MSKTRKASISFLHRKPRIGHHSLERMYAAIRSQLDAKFNCARVVCPFESVGVIPRIKNFIFANRIAADIVHITGDITYLALACRGKVVVTIPDLAALHRLKGLRRIVFRLIWLYFPIWRADHVVCISEFTRGELCAEFPWIDLKCSVIYPPLLPEFEKATKTDSGATGRKVILHLGTADNKNLSRVIDAVVGLNCKLIVVGVLSARNRDALVGQGIVFENPVGVTDHLILELYRNADIISFPSTYEGFGMPVIEGQAVGCIVVTSRMASIPEVAGEAAIYVDALSVQSIAAGFARAINLSEAAKGSLISMGRTNARRFSISNIAESHERLYEVLFRA